MAGLAESRGSAARLPQLKTQPRAGTCGLPLLQSQVVTTLYIVHIVTGESWAHSVFLQTLLLSLLPFFQNNL